MKKLSILLFATIAVAACCNQPKGTVIDKQGVFSSGGTVTAPIPGDYDPTQNWMDQSRAGTTTHVDHANTFYQIPADGNGLPWYSSMATAKPARAGRLRRTAVKAGRISSSAKDIPYSWWISPVAVLPVLRRRS